MLVRKSSKKVKREYFAQNAPKKTICEGIIEGSAVQMKIAEWMLISDDDDHGEEHEKFRQVSEDENGKFRNNIK